MLRQISDWIYQVTGNRVALVALVVFLVFTTLVLPGQASQRDMEGRFDISSPDLSLWYSAEQLYRIAEVYGESGRAQYVRSRFSFDLIWPLVYGIFLSTGITWIFSRAFIGRIQWQWVNLAPIAGVFFDYMENIFTSIVMLRYPERTPGVDLFAGIFTLTKWVFVAGSFVVLIVGIIVGIWRWSRKWGRM